MFKIATNFLSGIVALTIVYLTIYNITPAINSGNYAVIITGMFPAITSFAMFIGTLISPPTSLIRILYIVGMFFTLILGA